MLYSVTVSVAGSSRHAIPAKPSCRKGERRMTRLARSALALTAIVALCRAGAQAQGAGPTQKPTEAAAKAEAQAKAKETPRRRASRRSRTRQN